LKRLRGILNTQLARLTDALDVEEDALICEILDCVAYVLESLHLGEKFPE